MVDRSSPDGLHPEELTLGELEWLRAVIRGSVDRTEAELERVEEVILAATLREQQRAESACHPAVRIEMRSEPSASGVPTADEGAKKIEPSTTGGS